MPEGFITPGNNAVSFVVSKNLAIQYTERFVGRRLPADTGGAARMAALPGRLAKETAGTGGDPLVSGAARMAALPGSSRLAEETVLSLETPCRTWFLHQIQTGTCFALVCNDNFAVHAFVARAAEDVAEEVVFTGFIGS
jgi:hypothetical protein